MKHCHFLFDFDSTITQKETLPFLAELLGMEQQLHLLTQQDMGQLGDFATGFRHRVSLLQHIPLAQIHKKMRQMPLNPKIAAFIKTNRQRCTIVTGNLDIWITPILTALSMENQCLSSLARLDAQGNTKILSVLDKGDAVGNYPHPFVAIGDGSNDIPMLQAAHIAIAYSGVRPAAAALCAVADHVFDAEEALVDFLKKQL